MPKFKIEDVQLKEVTLENPLEIPRVTKREDGGVDVFLALSAEQTYVLLEFAIMSLVSHGFVKVIDQEPREASQAQTAEQETPQDGTIVTAGEQLH